MLCHRKKPFQSCLNAWHAYCLYVSRGQTTVKNVVAITNRKGGSGKTTTSVNLSAALALKGYRVVLVDADPQAHSALSLGLRYAGNAPGLYDVLIGDAGMDDVMRKTPLKNLRVIAGGKRLTDFERDNARNSAARTVMGEKISEITAPVDYLFIDTPPTLSLMTLSSLIAGTKVIIPMQAHFLAMEGLAETLKILRFIEKRYGRSPVMMGVVPTFYRPSTRLARLIIEDIGRTLGEELLLSPIRTNVSLAEAPSHGKSIFQYNPRSHGARDYLTLANQIVGLCTQTQSVGAAT